MNRRHVSLASLAMSVAAVSFSLMSIGCGPDTPVKPPVPVKPPEIVKPTDPVKPPEVVSKAPVDPRIQGIASGDDGAGLFTALFFLYANFPATANQRGVPDPNGTFGNGPAVWETMKNSTEIYRPLGATPCPWETVCELPDGVTPPTTQQLQQQFGPTNSTWLHFLSGDSMIDGQKITDAHSQFIRFDVRCNQDYFNYVTANAAGYPLYNTEGQETARTDPNFNFDFPAMTYEVKAAWRILGKDDEDSRYWTAYGAYYDEAQVLQFAKIGLTAFHVISHAIPNWAWMTFEQVDNPTETYTYFLGEKSEQNPIGPNTTTNSAAGPFNELLQQSTKGTKWQYYQIIGWQVDEHDSQGEPVVLANTNIETYFPQTSSCMSCHAMANIGPPDNRRLNMWQTDNNGIQGRVGDIDFPVIAGKLAPGQKVKQMNFVWSLREAQSTQVAVKKPKSR